MSPMLGQEHEALSKGVSMSRIVGPSMQRQIHTGVPVPSASGPHGVSGRPQGEVIQIAEMKGSCISMQWHGEFVPDFGEHLPRLPTS